MTKRILFGCGLLLTIPFAASAQAPAVRNLRALDPLAIGSEPVAPAKSTKPGEGDKNVATAPKPPTEITCETEANFEEKSHKAIFIGAVLVKDPEFTLNCDKLTAFLKQPPPKEPKKNPDGTLAVKPDGKSTPKPKASPTPAVKPISKPAADGGKPAGAKDEAAPSGSGIDRALAEGHVVIVQDKPDPDGGEPVHYVGKSSRADYDANTGDIVLSGTADPATWPQLQQGINTHIAMEAGVVMTLNRAGALHSKGGKTKTVISDQGGDDKNKAKKTK